MSKETDNKSLSFPYGSLKEYWDEIDNGRKQDPEWTEPYHYHLRTLITAFSVGILMADPWYKDYRMPPHFKDVMDWISFCIQREYKERCVSVSLLEMKEHYSKWIDENPYCREWCKDAEPDVFFETGMESPNERGSILPQAIVENAVIYLKNVKRIEILEK